MQLSNDVIKFSQHKTNSYPLLVGEKPKASRAAGTSGNDRGSLNLLSRLIIVARQRRSPSHCP